MTNSNTLLYDTGRFPLWLRIPLVVFGLLMLWLGLAIASYGLFGVSLGISMENAHGSFFWGSLACFVLAALFIFIWFGQLQIFFDAAMQELVVRTRGYTRVHERRILLIGAREIHMRYFSMIGGSWWDVTVEFSDGRSEHVARIKSGIELFAKSLEATVNLPIARFTGEPPLNERQTPEIIIPTVFGISICVFIIVMNIRLLVIRGNWFSITWGVIGTGFVTYVLVGITLPAIRELWRRRRKK